MLSERLRVLYLHGFASSPASRKARFFAEKLAALGFAVEVPDLAEGDFEGLTITRQLAVVERLGRRERVIVIGSSLGGYLAALYAARHPEVDRLILLAPALRFHRLWSDEFGPDRLRLWREKGRIPVFHYGAGCSRLIGYQLMEDASRFEPNPQFSQPCLICHGTADPLVPIAQSVEFAATHANVRLIRLASGHELTDVLDEIWEKSEKFLVPNPGVK
jgi:pimeloyl-ACP methyl ester carboxylesterase